MNSPTGDNLDRLLQDWAERHAPDDERLESLQRQILERSDDVSLPPIASASNRHSANPQLLQSVAAIAAGVVIVGGLLFGLHRPVQQVADEIPIERLTRQELEDAAALYAAAYEQFDDRLAWLADSEQHFEVGLHEDPPTSDTSRPRVIVRLVAVLRDTHGQTWQQLWAIDVIADSEELVRISDESGRNGSVLIWPYVLADGNIAIDTQIDWDGPVPVRSAESAVQRPSVPATILSQESGESELRIISTVAVLPEDVG